LRRSDRFFFFILINLILLTACVGHGRWRQRQDLPARERNARLVRTLQLTDLALFTEARYTRHLSQADFHAALQDHPMALEHFPSGSMVAPPPAPGGVR
jgi:hypothetical protein